MKRENLKQSLLEVSEMLLREKGYNGWSYQDLSDAIGIRKASIHYYFPKKEDLGCALIEYYEQKSMNYLTQAESNAVTARDKLNAFVKLYASILDEPHSFCLCGMLAADLMTLPEKMQIPLKKSLQAQQDWLEKTLKEAKNELSKVKSFEKEASEVLSCLQGMLLIARLKSNPKKVFTENAFHYLDSKFK